MTFRLWERIQDWVYLVALLLLALVMMVAQNRPAVRGLRAVSLEATAWVESRFAWAGGYLRALNENTELRRENIDLASEVARSREARLENERLRRLLAFRDTTEYGVRAARIVAKELRSEQNNHLLLDVGFADSVKVGMPVVDERGILGKVVLVSEHYARVMPYRSPDFRVPARVQPIQAEGLVSWRANDGHRLVMEHVVKTDPVEPGQLVVTSGYSGTFPAGYPVGTVDTVMVQQGRNELLIYLTPTARLDDSGYAFVLLYQPDPERIALETAPPS